jgi:hypothetical protein
MPDIEPVRSTSPTMMGEKKEHEIDHFEGASKLEQTQVSVADRNRNVSAKYVLPSQMTVVRRLIK